MTIDEAIEKLQKVIMTLPVTLAESEKQAINLGIEALKAIRTGREDYYESQGHKLPGETEE